MKDRTSGILDWIGRRSWPIRTVIYGFALLALFTAAAAVAAFLVVGL